MSGLARVVTLYKLLERVREAEALTARSAVGEVDTQLSLLRGVAARVVAEARTAPEDAVLRTAAQCTTDSHAVLRGRLGELRSEREAAVRVAADELAASRLRVRQVEEVLQAAQREAELQAAKREQQAADERYLAQRYRAEQQAEGVVCDGSEHES